MKIMRVLGFATLIIVLKFLVPRIFAGFENVLLSFFDVFDVILTRSEGLMEANSASPFILPTVGIE